MTKQSGIGDNFYLGAYDLSGDIGALTGANVSRALLEVTGINKSAPERILGLADGELSFAAWHNATAGQSHAVLDDLPRTDVVATYAHGATLGNDAASILGKQVDYNTDRGADGSLAHAATVRGNGSALEWGAMQTAGTVSFAGTATGGTVDGGAASAVGGAAYLHVFSINGGTATFTVQDSTDGSTGWANVTGLAFTAASTVTAERVATSATQAIKRYTRVSCTNPGGGTAVVFVSLVRF